MLESIAAEVSLKPNGSMDSASLSANTKNRQIVISTALAAILRCCSTQIHWVKGRGEAHQQDRGLQSQYSRYELSCQRQNECLSDPALELASGLGFTAFFFLFPLLQDFIDYGNRTPNISERNDWVVSNYRLCL